MQASPQLTCSQGQTTCWRSQSMRKCPREKLSFLDVGGAAWSGTVGRRRAGVHSELFQVWQEGKAGVDKVLGGQRSQRQRLLAGHREPPTQDSNGDGSSWRTTGARTSLKALMALLACLRHGRVC